MLSCRKLRLRRPAEKSTPPAWTNEQGQRRAPRPSLGQPVACGSSKVCKEKSINSIFNDQLWDTFGKGVICTARLFFFENKCPRGNCWVFLKQNNSTIFQCFLTIFWVSVVYIFNNTRCICTPPQWTKWEKQLGRGRCTVYCKTG